MSPNTPANSRAVSSYSRNGRPGGRSITCNKCRKPLSTTVFVCSCDCVFCEDCTYSHFNNSSSCPVCRRKLGTDDFVELVVADPSTAIDESLKNSFQNMFTKFVSSSGSLTYQEMCSRLLKSIDDDRRTVRFLLKQFVFDSKAVGQHSGSLGRAFEELKKEYTHVKQSMSSQRIQTDQTIADLQLRVQALTGTVQEQASKLDAKERQVRQFREMLHADGMARVPDSSHSRGSNGSRGSRHTPTHGRTPPMRRQSPNPNHSGGPMAGYIRQEKARALAKEQTARDFSRSRGPNPSDTDSVITPIIPPPSRQRVSLVPSTPRIRDLTRPQEYTFSSSGRHSQKRPRASMDSMQSGYSFSSSSGRRFSSVRR